MTEKQNGSSHLVKIIANNSRQADNLARRVRGTIHDFEGISLVRRGTEKEVMTFVYQGSELPALRIALQAISINGEDPAVHVVVKPYETPRHQYVTSKKHIPGGRHGQMGMSGFEGDSSLNPSDEPYKSA